MIADYSLRKEKREKNKIKKKGAKTFVRRLGKIFESPKSILNFAFLRMCHTDF